jgi:hypothetical protein
MATLPVLSIEGFVIATAIACYVAWGIYALSTHPEWILAPPRRWLEFVFGIGLAGGEACWIAALLLLATAFLTLPWILIAPLILMVYLPISAVLDWRADKKRVTVHDRELQKPDYENQGNSESRWEC